MQDDKRPPQLEHDPAKARFWTLQAVRLVGIVVALAGISGVAGKLDVSQLVAALLLAGGVGIYFGLPVALAKKWKADK